MFTFGDIFLFNSTNAKYNIGNINVKLNGLIDLSINQQQHPLGLMVSVIKLFCSSFFLLWSLLLEELLLLDLVLSLWTGCYCVRCWVGSPYTYLSLVVQQLIF